jgi:hypothetical protein
VVVGCLKPAVLGKEDDRARARARAQESKQSKALECESGRPDSKVDEIPRTIFNIDYVDGTVRNRLMADSALLRGLVDIISVVLHRRRNNSLDFRPGSSYTRVSDTPPTFHLHAIVARSFQPRSIDRRIDARSRNFVIARVSTRDARRAEDAAGGLTGGQAGSRLERMSERALARAGPRQRPGGSAQPGRGRRATRSR